MKKHLLTALSIALVFGWSCQSDDLQEVVNSEENKLALDGATLHGGAGALKNCASHAVLERQLQENPLLAKKLEAIEAQARVFEEAQRSTNGKISGQAAATNSIINIPVIVHVIYSTSQQNISDAQIQSQINVLNADFSAQNSEIGAGLVPTEFASRVANSEISFSLAQVTRTYSSRTEWGTRDDMKYTSKGGHDVIQPSKYLNIWVCNIGGGILGYAQFPGGNAATDGVVVGPQYFGDTGWVVAPFNKGRTTTHEIGHWLNLRHIWGDGRCNQDDFVSDTPTADRANYGCPKYPTVHCRTNDMTMNYMDYTDDACMYMFSNGQKTRMRALFASGGARQGFAL
ncbi:zinc metalloprotease [Cesiribacter andamanensis]|uniref:Zinc-dependent metalloproteinase lipoprotein, family n=1 Tax=Cesiribacter andamanensis AMV16 TaxID=1279009 RepID=M7NST7_9BACT|nr:zinc metalloprotease [Cesiribacter andamanensis]EMR01559.1 zinc-dependent metalloproteinase lipoprotein, family [Cesiribacter andamanensis AMV16]